MASSNNLLANNIMHTITKNAVSTEKMVFSKRAYELYRNGMAFHEIAEVLYTTPAQIKEMAQQNGWDALLAKDQKTVNELMAGHIEGRRKLLNKNVGHAVKILADQLDKLSEKSKNSDMDMTDLNSLTNILATLDKINRLESGKATDIVESRTITYEEAVRILKDDPFAREFKDDNSKH